MNMSISLAFQEAIEYHQAGRLPQAEARYQQILRVAPHHLDALHLSGLLAHELGRNELAVELIGKALVLQPDFVEAHSNIGLALKELGKLNEAVWHFRKALSLRPDYAEVHSNLGIVFQEQGKLNEAAASYRLALSLKPDFVEVYYSLGNVLRDQGRLDEAIGCCRTALVLQSDAFAAYNNLGNLLRMQGKLDEAAECYLKTLALKPDYEEMYANLGGVLLELGKLDEAVKIYQKALEIRPDAFQYAIFSHLLLPIIPDSVENITSWRKRFQNGIASLRSIPGSLENPGSILGTPSFFLAYHNQNDRPLMEDLCNFFRARIAELTATAPHILCWQPPMISGKRIRVGFLSEFLVDHTIGKHYKGYIQHLDRSRFEVWLIHAPTAKQDALRQELDGMADKSITLPENLKDQQQAVAEAELDVLFYPDIGMSQSTYFLAYARLAPVQATSWGHPDTSGLDTIDYYVSSSVNEPEDAEAYYTERLIRLNRLPCFYYRTAPGQSFTKAELGLPETGTLYGCPQALFKFHPDFDAVLAAIAEGDPTGYIVLPEGNHFAWTNQLKTRWNKRFPALLNRVLFLPRMPWNHFMAAIAQMDVLLDPLYFGSGNTLYDAMVTGTPVVTWPGQFARGRNVAAAYQQMGVADAPVAHRVEDYAPLALALGRDTERRRVLRIALLKAAERELFEDMQAVREFEGFLEAAVGAAGSGEKLPPDWRPVIKVLQDQLLNLP